MLVVHRPWEESEVVRRVPEDSAVKRLLEEPVVLVDPPRRVWEALALLVSAVRPPRAASAARVHPPRVVWETRV
jgi:hypothetical protein